MQIRQAVSVLAIALATLFSSIASAAERYIEVTADTVKIRFSPSMSSLVIAEAKKGDVFKLFSEKGQWYGIIMFSGEERYLEESLAVPTQYDVTVPAAESVRHQLFKAFWDAEGQGMKEAERKYPSDLTKQIDYQRILDDRYKLEVFHEFGILAPVYGRIAVEGAKKKWWR